MNIFGMGTQELLLVLLICLLVFGAEKLPEIGRALGKTIKEFKRSVHDDAGSDASETESGTKA